MAIVAALYTSFWLELQSPSTAALTVTVLALPTRGQGMEKAAFRLIATVLGVMASVAIVGLFAQSGGIMLAAFGRIAGRQPRLRCSTRHDYRCAHCDSANR